MLLLSASWSNGRITLGVLVVLCPFSLEKHVKEEYHPENQWRPLQSALEINERLNPSYTDWQPKVHAGTKVDLLELASPVPWAVEEGNPGRSEILALTLPETEDQFFVVESDSQSAEGIFCPKFWVSNGYELQQTDFPFGLGVLTSLGMNLIPHHPHSFLGLGPRTWWGEVWKHCPNLDLWIEGKKELLLFGQRPRRAALDMLLNGDSCRCRVHL